MCAQLSFRVSLKNNVHMTVFYLVYINPYNLTYLVSIPSSFWNFLPELQTKLLYFFAILTYGLAGL